MADLCDRRAIPWIAETPLIRVGHPSVFKLPKWLTVRLKPTTFHRDLHQCMFSELDVRPGNLIFKKGTSMLANFPLDGLSRLCNHLIRDWQLPSTGELRTSPHPPLRGRERWREMREGTPWGGVDGEQSDYMTQRTAHYPAEFTWQILGAIVAETAFRRSAAQPTAPVGHEALRDPVQSRPAATASPADEPARTADDVPHSCGPQVPVCEPSAKELPAPHSHASLLQPAVDQAEASVAGAPDLSSGIRSVAQATESLFPPPAVDHSGRPVVRMTDPMRGQVEGTTEHQIGGLRDLHRSIQRLPGHQVAGVRIREAISIPRCTTRPRCTNVRGAG